MAIIRCTVSNCEYWRQKNYCSAEQILVTAPQSPLQAAEKHGMGAETLKNTPVRLREDSLCYTWEVKGTNR